MVYYFYFIIIIIIIINVNMNMKNFESIGIYKTHSKTQKLRQKRRIVVEIYLIYMCIYAYICIYIYTYTYIYVDYTKKLL